MLKQLQDLLVYWDYIAWYYLNTVWHNSFLDAVIPFLRNQWTWAPLYLFLLIFMPMNYKAKGWIWCIFFLITFSLSDFISASMIKPFFHRVRPCNNPYLQHIVHLLVPCGSGLSFPSSHAANHFSLGVFAAMSLNGTVKGIWWIGLIWAFSVAYAQVYVGVHFPMDVLAGGLLGAIIGIITGYIYRRLYKLDRSPA